MTTTLPLEPILVTKDKDESELAIEITISGFNDITTIQDEKEVTIQGPLCCSFIIDDKSYTTKPSKNGVWNETFKIESLEDKEKTFVTFELYDAETEAIIANSELYLDSLIGKAGKEISVTNPLSNVTSGFFSLKVKPNFELAPLVALDGKIPKKATAVVIGSGFAGSNVARQLYDRKVDVILIEAQEAFGGRCSKVKLQMTDKNDKSEYYFDAGSNFMAKTNNYLYQFCDRDEELKPLIIDTFDIRKYSNYDSYEPLTPKEEEAYIEEYNKTHKEHPISIFCRNPMQIEVFQRQKMVYDFRTPIIPSIQGIPSQWNYYEVLCAGLLLVKIQLIEQLIDIEDPLLKGEYYDEFRDEGWFQNLEEMVHEMDNQVYAEWGKENVKFASENVQETLIQVMGISIQAPLSVKSEQCSTLFSFLFNKSNGGFSEVINDAEGGPQQYALRNSFHQVIEKLDKPLVESNRAFLNKPVTKIDYPKDAEVGKIELKDGTVIEADYIINCSGVVASQNIDFEKGTISPGRDFVQTQSEMGSTIKTFICYEKPWWRVKDTPEKSFSGYVGAVQNSKMFDEEYPKDKTNTTWFYDVSYQKEMLNQKPVYTLMTFITDQDCIDVLEKKSTEEDVKEIVLEHLRYYFRLEEDDKPNPEIENYVGFCMGEWWKETPYIQGGPNAVYKPGTYSKGNLSTRGLNPNLHFCNSEYAGIDKGYMSGALCIGKQVANDVLKQLKIPTVEDTFMTTPVPYTLEGQKKLEYVTLKPTYWHWVELEVLNDFMYVFGKTSNWVTDVVGVVKFLFDQLKKLVYGKDLGDKNGPIAKFDKLLQKLSDEKNGLIDSEGNTPLDFNGVVEHFK